MKESFIAFLWRHLLLHPKKGHMLCITGESICILHPGQENRDSGPDFVAARIRINGTVWAGNVEIHVRSSAWYDHGHHLDEAYGSVILHVVYHCDKVVTDTCGVPIPHLEISPYFDKKLHETYRLLITSKTWIPCAHLIHQVPSVVFSHWIQRMLIWRLERKSAEVRHYLHFFGHHWEKLFLFLLARYLGGTANGASFGMLIQRTPYKVIARNSDRSERLEALFLGQAGLFEQPLADAYVKRLAKEYLLMKKTYPLPPSLHMSVWKYARMRPASFPDIRIAQLAHIVCAGNARLFEMIMGQKNLLMAEKLFSAKLPSYWKTHYRLNKASPGANNHLGEKSIHCMVINGLVPLAYVYGKVKNDPDLISQVIDLLCTLPAENNHVIRKWSTVAEPPQNAGESQGLLELFASCCLEKRCLECALGHTVMRRCV